MINANDRLHFQKKGKITKYLRGLACYQSMDLVCEADGLPFSKDRPCIVKVTTYSPTRRKYDPPNWSPTVKAILDGLTDAGVWVDDNYEIIKTTSFSHGGLSGSKLWKIILEIEEMPWTS
ncbi:Phage protein [Streptococcus sp. DD10]|nr:Phage protein [Streptococcus sp. DD10]